MTISRNCIAGIQPFAAKIVPLVPDTFTGVIDATLNRPFGGGQENFNFFLLFFFAVIEIDILPARQMSIVGKRLEMPDLIDKTM